MKKIIRVLHVVPNMNSGGIENLIMNIYRNIDREKLQFDFLVHYNKRSYFDDEIEKLGGKIYRFPVLENKNLIKYLIDLNRFFSLHREYKIIHGHMSSLAFFYLGLAKKNGIPVRIAHSHGSSHLKSIKGYLKHIMFRLAKINANYYFACSTEAGKYLFGNKSKFKIIPNAIDLNKFKFDNKKRIEIRKKLGLKYKFVIGHVGRFSMEKNHDFIIDIYNAYFKINKNSALVLIGVGELEKKIKEKINELNLNDNVLMLGLRNDVADLYQAMDLFLMSSIYEGLPLTGIEAQESGLCCLFSDTITKEVKISNNIKFLSLSDSCEKWAEEIAKSENYDRLNVEMHDSLFDIKNLAKRLEKFYIENNNKDGE